MGFALIWRTGGWTVGLDGHREVHDANIDNPNQPMFFVQGFDSAERQILGAFVEKYWAFANNWQAELGLRLNRITMDSDAVDATPAAMGMPPAVALRESFNGADRSSTDVTADWVAKLYYGLTDELTLYAGASRKNPCASLSGTLFVVAAAGHRRPGRWADVSR